MEKHPDCLEKFSHCLENSSFFQALLISTNPSVKYLFSIVNTNTKGKRFLFENQIVLSICFVKELFYAMGLP